MTLVKICGLTTPETVDAAVEAGADYLGFVLFPKSPRALTAAAAAPLVERARGRAKTVLLLVDPDDTLVAQAAALGPDLLQLHGSETPERVAAVRSATGLPVIKAAPVSTAEDLAKVERYGADHVMLDARPPAAADRPGGHGAAFDWTLLTSANPLIPAQAGTQEPDFGAESAPLPAVRVATLGPGLRRDEREIGSGALWFLAGGLNPGNVAEALRITRAPAVDVSSGVERAPGVKDPALIAAFIRAVRAYDAEQP